MVALAKEYIPAIKLAVVEQIILLFIGATILDGGVMLRHFTIAAIGFWCGVLIMVIRRPYAPTRADLDLIKAGYFALAGLTLLLSAPIYRLAEYLGK